MEVPNVKRKDFQLIGLDDDFLSLMDDTGDTRDDLKCPEDAIGDEIKAAIEKETDILVSLSFYSYLSKNIFSLRSLSPSLKLPLIHRSLASLLVARSVSLPPRSTPLLTSKKSNVCFALCKISRFLNLRIFNVASAIKYEIKCSASHSYTSCTVCEASGLLSL